MRSSGEYAACPVSRAAKSQERDAEVGRANTERPASQGTRGVLCFVGLHRNPLYITSSMCALITRRLGAPSWLVVLCVRHQITSSSLLR